MNKSKLNNWKRINIGSISIGIYDGPHATPKPTDKGAIYLGIKNITEDGKLDFSDIRYISEEEFPKWVKRVIPKEGDIVFTYEATLNRYAIIPKKFRGCLGRRTALIRPDNSKVDTKFLFYYFFGEDWRRTISQNLLFGSTVDRVPISRFPEFEISLPSLPTQQKIGSILSTYDNLIENNTKRIKILEEMAQNLYYEWFVKFKFPGYEKVKMIESELGLIPEGWKVQKLGNYIQTQKGFAFKSQWYQQDGVKIVKVSNFTNDSIDTQNLVCIPEEIAKKYDKEKLYANEIIIQTVGSWASNPNSVVGKVIRVPRQAENSLLNQNAVKLIPNIIINTTFLYYLLKRDEFKKYIVGCGQGAASQASITLDSIKGFIFLLPSIELLNLFHQFVLPIWEILNSLNQKNQNLRQTRDLLLPKLISGEIDVDSINIDTQPVTEAVAA